MVSLAPLTEVEARQLVDNWYAKLDVHAPVEELYPMLADEGLEMRFPEATLHGQSEFKTWYEGVTRKFFDEVHTLKDVNVKLSPERASVQLVVNWQAHIWNPPAPKSQWIGFDAAQRWVVTRSPKTQRPVIAIYIVDALTPMPGSPNL
jgi:hypothetical protein